MTYQWNWQNRKIKRILKAARDKWSLTYKDRHIRVVADLSTETMQARRKWQEIVNVLDRKNMQPRILYPSRLSFRIEWNKGFPRQTETKVLHPHDSWNRTLRAPVTVTTKFIAMRGKAYRSGQTLLTRVRPQTARVQSFYSWPHRLIITWEQNKEIVPRWGWKQFRHALAPIQTLIQLIFLELLFPWLIGQACYLLTYSIKTKLLFLKATG